MNNNVDIPGKQQCMNGIDEDHCEELEYNECEDNEYRCHDGSCIDQEYWLDGEFDCSDKSDEQDSDLKSLKRRFCPLISSEFDCDEATDDIYYFACGDGQFIEDTIVGGYNCYNYRQVMFFCEFPWGYFEKHPKWTLDNGHCVDKGWIQNNFTNLTESEQCILYLKCQLTRNGSDICDDLIKYSYPLCHNRTIRYPSKSLFNPYVQTFYDLRNLDLTAEPNSILFNGSIKCMGHQVPYELHSSFIEWSHFDYYRPLDILFCHRSRTMNNSSPQINESCWIKSKNSFLCEKSTQCISKHRLENGIKDCFSGEDELDNQQSFLTNAHRLKCSNGNSFKYISTTRIGDYHPDCEQFDDERIVQLKWNLFDHKCTKDNLKECDIIKSYILSNTSLRITNETIIPFRRYCDSTFHLSKGFDELNCKEWKCPRTHYQCLSGHCIPIEIFNSEHLEWNCPDASDSNAFFRLTNLSEHNSQIVQQRNIEEKISLLSNGDIRTFHQPFLNICNYTKEYGCLLANVDQPFNFNVNRPCINLAQIGDGIIDCYGGLDERNLLTCGKNEYEQRGFDFHCSNEECIPYHRLCKDRCSNNADHLLCVQLQSFRNSSCLYDAHFHSCVNIYSTQCYSIQFGKYYCDLSRSCKQHVVFSKTLEKFLFFFSVFLSAFKMTKKNTKEKQKFSKFF